MNFRYHLIIVISSMSLVTSIDESSFNMASKFTLSGQIKPWIPFTRFIEPGSQMILQLQGISMNNNVPITISQLITPVMTFPILFQLIYMSHEIRPDFSYEINVRIINHHNNLLFANENPVEVKLLGNSRMTYIEIPVVFLEQLRYLRLNKVLEWPELVGMDGHEVLNIIKQQTGFKKVFLIYRHSKVPKDIRYDRVFIYIDDSGKVIDVPRVG